MIKVPTDDVAADAAGLPFVWLEVTYRANWEGRAEQARGRPKSSLRAIPGRMEASEGLPAEHDVHALTAPPTDADPVGHGAQLDSSTA